MSESPAKVQPNPAVRPKFVQSGVLKPRTFGLSDDGPSLVDTALHLIGAAVQAKLAAELGAPRLATSAARKTAEIAETSRHTEDDRLGDVRTTADLLALLRPDPDDQEML